MSFLFTHPFLLAMRIDGRLSSILTQIKEGLPRETPRRLARFTSYMGCCLDRSVFC
jgi:hypothetical protein